MKNIVVTGGAGFIGSHLVEFLVKKNFKVTVIDNLSNGNLKNLNNFKKKIKFIKCDIRNKNKIFKILKNKDIVFHLAALADIVPSIENPSLYYDVNVTGTRNLLEASRKNRIKKFIYAASSSCYGIPKKYPTSEKTFIDPEYPYALTKYIGELLVQHYNKIYNLNTTSIRLFNVYGPRSRTSGTYGAVFGVFLRQKLSNKPFTIVGNGKQTRDFTFVSDVVSALYNVYIKQKKGGNIYNVGSGNSISVNKIAKLLGGKRVYIPKRPGEPSKTFADIKKIKNNLKWSPKIPIEKGVEEILKNIDYWKSAPLWSPKSIRKATKSWFKYLKK